MPDGLEPSLRAYETQVVTVTCHHILAPVVGIEPTTRGFGDRRSTIELHRHIGGECQNRTLDWRLEISNFAIKLIPHELNL